jgi:hypothetical protein
VRVDTHDSLSGQVALVTGTTRGIGEQTARILAEHDATVYAGARDPDDVTAGDRHPLELDVTDDAGMRAAVDRVEEEAGRCWRDRTPVGWSPRPAPGGIPGPLPPKQQSD